MYWSDILKNPQIILNKQSKEFINIKCDNCDIIKSHKIKYLKQDLKNTVKNKYCSISCLNEKKGKSKNNCFECNKETSNSKFCSSSCAASFNNKNRKHTQKTKDKISNSIKTNGKQRNYAKSCKV
ncbi:MAG: hypothetical protein ABFD07_14470, partial [Methanobacterium sp.]